jgi:glycerophosphoryl diester phosphodiesterase
VGHWENTLEAFGSAVAMGAAMVELDCKLTGDGHVVVLHDHTLTRLWGVRKPVSGCDWSELSTIRRNGYRIPDLAETLATMPIPVMVDVPTVAIGEAALAVVEAARATDRCIFAGHVGALVRLHQASAQARIALTWDKRELPGGDLLAATKPEWLNPRWRLATTDLVERAHAAGMGVSVWTVDRTSDIRRVIAAGVDAVITNQTARAVAALQPRPGQPGPRRGRLWLDRFPWAKGGK